MNESEIARGIAALTLAAILAVIGLVLVISVANHTPKVHAFRSPFLANP